MIEVDSRGAPVQLAALDAEWLLELAADAEVLARAADRRKLHYALRWCELHAVDDPDEAARWTDAGGDLRGIERRLGGEGTPLVREFAAEAFAAALCISTRAGMQLMADALEIFHRLPALAARVESLSVAPWRARRIAEATVGLSPEAAAYVDEQLAPLADRCGATRIDKTVADAVAMHDPAETAAVEDVAEATWGVWIDHGVGPTWSGTSTIQITGDTPTLTRFHDVLRDLAHGLRVPDGPDLDHRMIAALGLLADHACASGTATSTASTTLFVHVGASDLDTDLDTDGAAMGFAERLGPVTLARIRRWVAAGSVRVQPLLDLGRRDVVDRHDPPAWMRELVVQRDPTCVFPWCGLDSRRCDLDHIEPWGAGGQTGPDNLAPLCRRHHRAKTFGGWRYQRERDGTYTWTDPHGARITDPRGRRARFAPWAPRIEVHDQNPIPPPSCAPI